MYDGPEETCITPMYGFRSPQERDAYVGDRKHLVTGEGPGRWFAQNRFAAWNGSATRLLTEDVLKRRQGDGKPVWRDLCNERNLKHKPSNAYNVLMLRPGKLQFVPGNAPRDHRELQRISWMQRDCYAVWEDQDMNPLTDPTATLTIPYDEAMNGDPTPEPLRYSGHPRRWVCGVIFARTTGVMANPHHGLDNVGWMERVRYTTVRIDIMDRDPRKGDAVKIWANRHWCNGHFGSPAEPHLDDGNEWKGLIEQAAAGFKEHCTPCTDELRARYEEVLASTREVARQINDRRRRERRWR